MMDENIMTDTNLQYDRAIATCKKIFMQKTVDYGTSWRVLRPISIVDQIFIKAQRIRTIQQKGIQRVEIDILRRAQQYRGHFIHKDQNFKHSLPRNSGELIMAVDYRRGMHGLNFFSKSINIGSHKFSRIKGSCLKAASFNS